jgi:hypothetical protein
MMERTVGEEADEEFEDRAKGTARTEELEDTEA